MKMNFKKIIYPVFSVTFFLFLCFSAYSFVVLQKCSNFYHFVKNPYKGWEGLVHQADPELGYRAMSNVSGAENITIGEPVPMKYDKNGYRIPLSYTDIDFNKRPLILFIGDSFTYGSACVAEDTFPFIVGKDMNASVINTGTISYGFAQMLIIARELIPKYKPDFVVFQSSPWLLARALEMYRATTTVKVPMPYIYSKGVRQYAVRYPVFVTNSFALPIEKYKKTAESFNDYVGFLFEVGVPFYVYDDWNTLKTKFLLTIGRIPKPVDKDFRDVETWIYEEIYNICHKNNAKLVVCFLGNKGWGRTYTEQLKFTSDFIIVDAESVLWEKLSDKTQTGYDNKYKHWRGNPSVMVDHHPNPEAHKIIADAIYKGIVEKYEILKKRQELLNKVRK
ncbi:MAG TPA: hypothetical protein PKY78_06165 [Candidatus Omnitrophota bacterium]|nr:hypothetical protein [Candidatus Omnitrophota bacterium]